MSDMVQTRLPSLISSIRARRFRHLAPAISLPPLVHPLPFLPPLCLSLAILMVQNLSPLAEALLTRHLRTRTTISHLSVKWPRVTIPHLQLVDHANAPLLEVHYLDLRLVLSGLRRARIYVCASRATIHAHVSTTDFTHSNWSNHLARIASQQSPLQPQYASQPERGSSSEMKSEQSRWTIAASAGEALVLLMNPGPPPLYLRLQLPPLRMSTEDVASLAAISRLLDGLVGRATRDAGVGVFPREMRAGARRAARTVAVSAIDNVFAGARRRVAQWRRRADEAHEFVQDLPEVQDATSWLGDVRDVLGVMERIFSRPQDGIPEGERHRTPASNEKNSASQFRELDEGL